MKSLAPTEPNNGSASMLDTLKPAGSTRRLLVVAHLVEGCQGGVGTAVRHLIDGQAKDDTIGSIHLLADADRMGDMLQGVPAEVHLYKSSRSPALLRRVADDVQRILKTVSPDIVYLHSTFPGVYGRLNVSGPSRAWTILYCAHGWAFNQAVSKIRRFAYELIERFLAHRADAIVSISHHEHQSAIAAGITHRRHQVILHGIPCANAMARPVIEPGEEGIHLLFVGRFDAQKGVDLLFDAWRDPRLNGVHLWLIGEKTLASDQPVPSQPNVHALGWIRNDRMDGYIQSFDAVIMPSRWEGFGLVALEAMRNGKPVLASRAGGLPELILDRVNGRLFNPDATEEVIELLCNLRREDLFRMGETARIVFHTGFEWDTCYRQWRQLSMELLHRKLKTTA